MPFTRIKSGMKTVMARTMARNRNPDRNFPTMICPSLTGEEVSSTSVPVWRSSATRRIEMKMLAIIVRPLV